MRDPISYTQALQEATHQLMSVDPKIFVMGLGVSYPKGADGTTAGLKAAYPERVFDVPVSENGFTGMAVGAAIQGLHPIVHHGRVEFALLAMDPIITQAAKWNYMFGGNNPVPIVFRINIGRQWGNGPQHTQALYPLFGNALGLKVVIPSTPYMARVFLPLRREIQTLLSYSSRAGSLRPNNQFRKSCMKCLSTRRAWCVRGAMSPWWPTAMGL